MSAPQMAFLALVIVGFTAYALVLAWVVFFTRERDSRPRQAHRLARRPSPSQPSPAAPEPARHGV